jgi:hypothetical protein
VLHSANGPQHFIGVISTADGELSFYDTPRLNVPNRR